MALVLEGQIQSMIAQRSGMGIEQAGDVQRMLVLTNCAIDPQNCSRNAKGMHFSMYWAIRRVDSRTNFFTEIK